jgi:DNA-directed RNA polymerase specialized sigma24 family protein
MAGPRSGRVVELNSEARAALEALTRRTTVAVGVARRARIVLLAADGVPLDRIARQLGVDRNVVRTWVDRYRGGGRAALRDRPRPGRPRTFSPGGGAAPGAARL